MMFLPSPNMPHNIQTQQNIVCRPEVNYEEANTRFRLHKDPVNGLVTDSQTGVINILTLK